MRPQVHLPESYTRKPLSETRGARVPLWGSQAPHGSRRFSLGWRDVTAFPRSCLACFLLHADGGPTLRLAWGPHRVRCLPQQSPLSVPAARSCPLPGVLPQGSRTPSAYIGCVHLAHPAGQPPGRVSLTPVPSLLAFALPGQNRLCSFPSWKPPLVPGPSSKATSPGPPWLRTSPSLQLRGPSTWPHIRASASLLSDGAPPPPCPHLRRDSWAPSLGPGPPQPGRDCGGAEVCVVPV